MGRPHDWSALDRSADPVPGDPEEVASARDSLRNVATAIADVVDGVRNIGKDSDYELNSSKAVDAWNDRAEGAVAKLEKAKPRYTEAGTAMADYYHALFDAQAESIAALNDALSAVEDKNRASTTMDAHEPGSSEYEKASNDYDQAHAGLDKAKSRLARAEAARDEAAEKAERRISTCIGSDGVKDSIWDDLEKFADILSNIAGVLGVLALLVNFIPVIGQALSAILGAAALILGAIALIIHLGAAIENGEGWDKVFWDALGLVTFGVGRAAGAGAKVASMIARRGAWSALKGLTGPAAKALQSGGYAFVSKGPLTAKGLAALESAGVSGALKASFSGIPGEIGASFKVLGGFATGGFEGALQAGGTQLAHAASGGIGQQLFEAGLTSGGMADVVDSMRGINGLGDFAEAAGPKLAQSLAYASSATTYAGVAVGSNVVGAASTVFGVGSMIDGMVH